MSGCQDGCGVDFAHVSRRERRTLQIALLLNAGMFVAEFSAGLGSGSTALLADSLDMLADAIVYGMGLFALGRARHWRARTALGSGSMEFLLGLGVAGEAMWKLLGHGLPDTMTMGVFGVLALVVNTVCFVLLARFRGGEINLRATWICSRNDMLGNVGVLVAAALVQWLNSPLPDIGIGLLIALIVMRSAWLVIREAREELRSTAVNNADIN